MSIADEIERLSQLHQSGALTDAEFAAAKRRLIGGEGGEPDTLGQAANRYVSLQAGLSVVGAIVFLIVLFTVFLPLACNVSRGFDSGPVMPLPSGLHP